MGRIRAIFVMLTLVAMALLPGPTHVLAGTVDASAGATHTHPHAGPSTHHATIGHHVPCHGRGCGKACPMPCCAPAIAAMETPAISANGARRLRPTRPAADRERGDAARARVLRPPAPLA